MRLIDADALEEQAYEGGGFDYRNVVDFSDIEDAHTIDAVPVVHGRWEILEEATIFDACGNHAKYAACTNCGFRWSDIYAVKNYFKCCPHCGAKMDGKETLRYEKAHKRDQSCDLVDEKSNV